MVKKQGGWQCYVGFIGAAAVVGAVIMAPFWASEAHTTTCLATAVSAGLLAAVSFAPLSPFRHEPTNPGWLCVTLNCLPPAIALTAITALTMRVLDLWQPLRISYTVTPLLGRYPTEVLLAAAWLLVVINLRHWWNQPPYVNRVVLCTAWLWPLALMALIFLACCREGLSLPLYHVGRPSRGHYPSTMRFGSRVEAFTLAVYSSLLVFIWSWLLFWCAWPMRQKIEYDVPRCDACGYDLRGTVAAGRTTCPECGKEAADETA